MKPNSELPGTKRLKLKCAILLSTSAFGFNLRRSTKVTTTKGPDVQKVFSTKEGVIPQFRFTQHFFYFFR